MKQRKQYFTASGLMLVSSFTGWMANMDYIFSGALIIASICFLIAGLCSRK